LYPFNSSSRRPIRVFDLFCRDRYATFNKEPKIMQRVLGLIGYDHLKLINGS